MFGIYFSKYAQLSFNARTKVNKDYVEAVTPVKMAFISKLITLI